MNCQTCGTELTQFNATSYRHVHDIGNCAQVLLAQRDTARWELRDLVDACEEFNRTMTRWPHVWAIIQRARKEHASVPPVKPST